MLEKVVALASRGSEPVPYALCDVTNIQVITTDIHKITQLVNKQNCKDEKGRKHHCAIPTALYPPRWRRRFLMPSECLSCSQEVCDAVIQTKVASPRQNVVHACVYHASPKRPVRRLCSTFHYSLYICHFHYKVQGLVTMSDNCHMGFALASCESRKDQIHVGEIQTVEFHRKTQFAPNTKKQKDVKLRQQHEASDLHGRKLGPFQTKSTFKPNHAAWVSKLFWTGRATVHFCFQGVCVALHTLQSQFIRLPEGEITCMRSWTAWKRDVISLGAVDQWMDPISQLLFAIMQTVYYSRSGSCSIILQAVVDHLSREWYKSGTRTTQIPLLTCQSRKSTRVNNSIIGGSVPLSAPCRWVSKHKARTLKLAHLHGKLPSLISFCFHFHFPIVTS